MDTILLEQMGTRIFERRKQLRLTQEELAEAAGITPQTVSTAELGKKAMRPENIIKVCSALEISTDYLLMGKVASEDKNILLEKYHSFHHSITDIWKKLLTIILRQ